MNEQHEFIVKMKKIVKAHGKRILNECAWIIKSSLSSVYSLLKLAALY